MVWSRRSGSQKMLWIRSQGRLIEAVCVVHKAPVNPSRQVGCTIHCESSGKCSKCLGSSRPLTLQTMRSGHVFYLAIAHSCRRRRCECCVLGCFQLLLIVICQEGLGVTGFLWKGFKLRINRQQTSEHSFPARASRSVKLRMFDMYNAALQHATLIMIRWTIKLQKPIAQQQQAGLLVEGTCRCARHV